MRTTTTTFAFALAVWVPSSALAQSSSWDLTEETTVRFTCEGEDISRAARGRFAAVSGSLQLDPRDLSQVSGAIQVMLASITTWDGAWDAMFRRAPFLAIDEHPRARFELTGIGGASALTPGEWVRVRLIGRFSIHGETRNLSVPARMRWSAAADDTPETLQVRAQFRLPWSDYGINVPAGWTRRFAGDRANIEVQLGYRRGN